MARIISVFVLAVVVTRACPDALGGSPDDPFELTWGMQFGELEGHSYCSGLGLDPAGNVYVSAGRRS